MTVESLQAVYPHDKRDDAAQAVMVRAWADVLADVPYAVMREAARQWLRRDTHFMPSPGEFLALCKPILAEREAIARRAESLALGPEDGENIDAPADAEKAGEEREKVCDGFRDLADALRKGAQ